MPVSPRPPVPRTQAGLAPRDSAHSRMWSWSVVTTALPDPRPLLLPPPRRELLPPRPPPVLPPPPPPPPLFDFDEPPPCPRWALVSPFSRRCLFTIRAATSSSRPLYRPSFPNSPTNSLYSRSRFGLAPRGIGTSPFVWTGTAT